MNKYTTNLTAVAISNRVPAGVMKPVSYFERACGKLNRLMRLSRAIDCLPVPVSTFYGTQKVFAHHMIFASMSALLAVYEGAGLVLA